MKDRAEAEDRIRMWQGMGTQNVDHAAHGVWAVQLKDPAQAKDPARAKPTAPRETPEPLVGVLLLKSIPASGETLPLQPSRDTEIGWHFHPAYWGCGYASEATTVLAYGLDSGLDRVVAVTAPANTASLQVCLRIGMTHSGQTDRYYNALCELFQATAGY
jgi:RimJ/RimL family protein N-acetyltransferase